MKWASLLCSAAVLFAIGCESGSSTAPSTDPTQPREARKLTVTSPGEQNVTQDQTDEMTISISRENITGPVTVELKNLPQGVSVMTQNMTIPANKDSVVVTIKAEPNASPVNDHMVTITARANDVKDLPEATTTFKLDVNKKQ